MALTQRIESDLRTLEKLRIKPVFVFPGLIPNKRWKQNHHLEHNEACRDRRDAWAKYEAGLEEAATKLFEGRSSFAQWDLWRMVLRIFRHRNVEFIVAPYTAWSQVSFVDFISVHLMTCNDSLLVDISSAPSQIVYSCDLWSHRRAIVPWG